MKTISVLLAAPISEYKDYILDSWIQYIKSVRRSFSGEALKVSILLCDNSQNSSYYKQVSRRHEVPVIHVSPVLKNSRQFISESRNRLRDYFLNHQFDWFFSLECDVFADPNVLTNLLSHRRDIVSHPYFIGAGAQSTPMVQLLEPDPVPPLETRNVTTDEFFFLADDSLMRVFNAGLGCTLIHKNVLRTIRFRWSPDITFHDDSFFAEDCLVNGYSWFLDTSQMCRHYNTPWNFFSKNKY